MLAPDISVSCLNVALAAAYCEPEVETRECLSLACTRRANSVHLERNTRSEMNTRTHPYTDPLRDRVGLTSSTFAYRGQTGV